MYRLKAAQADLDIVQTQLAEKQQALAEVEAKVCCVCLSVLYNVLYCVYIYVCVCMCVCMCVCVCCVCVCVCVRMCVL